MLYYIVVCRIVLVYKLLSIIKYQYKDNGVPFFVHTIVYILFGRGGVTTWCKECHRETYNLICEICGQNTEDDIPYEINWCGHCNVPLIVAANSVDYDCPLCGHATKYLCSDLRPVFPEERLLLELLMEKPFTFHQSSVWANNNRYYIDGNSMAISSSIFRKFNPDVIRMKLEEYQPQNTDVYFNSIIKKFNEANEQHLNFLRDEAYSFIQKTASDYSHESIVISFSGGKDSTVVSDLAVRALSDPSLVHIFGNTTLEFPLTVEYARRFRIDHPKSIFKTAMNREQDFYKVCEDIGPPSRVMRWCCSMFKTGPITRVLNNLYRDRDILTFYGIRKCESVSRSKYNRIEDSSDAIKIQKQKVASPIFFWNDVDIWLYILTEGVDFNTAYRLGYDRVGCWCCPNNNLRAQFLSQIYMQLQSKEWREFLIEFAKKIGKPDPEVYVDTGKWKARQGGNGLVAAQDVKIRYSNCTSEENAKVYELDQPLNEILLGMLTPFGRIAPELGRKLINETIVVDQYTNIPILSIQPFTQEGFEYSVKIKTINITNHEDVQRMVGYQIRKFNACRRCLKCESLCRQGAISITADEYKIDPQKCTHCKMCVTAKYLDGGCMMTKYLKTKA